MSKGMVIYVNRIFLRQDKSAHKNFIFKATVSVSDTYQGLYNLFFYFPLDKIYQLFGREVIVHKKRVLLM